MGYERNHAIVVSDCGYGDFIERAHVAAVNIGGAVTPIVAGATNAVRSFAVLSDGSKEGWEESDLGDSRRASLVTVLRSFAYGDGSSPLKWAEIQYGDDKRETKVVSSSDDDRRRYESEESD